MVNRTLTVVTAYGTGNFVVQYRNPTVASLWVTVSDSGGGTYVIPDGYFVRIRMKPSFHYSGGNIRKITAWVITAGASFNEPDATITMDADHTITASWAIISTCALCGVGTYLWKEVGPQCSVCGYDSSMR